MNKFEKMDFKDLDENLGRREAGKKKNKPILNPEKLSSESDISVAGIKNDNSNPEDIMIAKEEGLITDDAKIEKIGQIDLGPHYFDSDLETINDKQELSAAAIEAEDAISESKESALAKGRAALTSKKRDDEFSVTESHGKRGREHKGKFKKGLDTIKKLLKIK